LYIGLDCVDIAPPLGGVKQGWVEENKPFFELRQYLENGRR